MKKLQTIKEKYRICFSNRYFILSLALAVAMLLASLVIDYHAGTYATEKAIGGPVPDIILSNIRVYDVDGIFLYGPILLWLFFSFVSFCDPKRLPFTIKSIVLFILIRSLFVTLTHLGPPVAIGDLPYFIRHYTFAGDLFFSAHTGFPFLMALLFWNNKKLRIFFLCCSLFFGIVVLLGHYHYSIDVLAAFFINYSIYDIAKYIFHKDLIMFNGGLLPVSHE